MPTFAELNTPLHHFLVITLSQVFSFHPDSSFPGFIVLSGFLGAS